MRITKEIKVDHPFWHKLLMHEHEHYKKNNYEDDPDQGITTTTELKVYSCTVPNCKFEKHVSKIWAEKTP